MAEESSRDFGGTFCFWLEVSTLLTCLLAATTTANAQGSTPTSTVLTSPLPACRKAYILMNKQNTNTGSTTENSSSSSGKMFGPLTEADFIGVIVAVVGVIISAIGVYFAYMQYYK
jgi:hypothetical protein